MSPLGGWVFPVSHHPRCPHPGRKPRGNKFCLHTHSDKCAFTSQGWKINPYRIQEHSSQELYTKAWVVYVIYSTSHIYTMHQWNSSCLTPYLLKSKQRVRLLLESVQFLFFFIFKKIFPSHPLLFSFTLPLSLRHSADQYQSYNDDEQPAWRKRIAKKHIFVFLHMLMTSGEDVDLLLCFLLSLHICKWDVCACGTNLYYVASNWSEYKYSAQKYTSTLGSFWVIP